ncbi:MAG TPA: radical SAM protein [Gemmatales bacterium]|nr:radical SAM protein [Gemmatales bacterium]
MKHKMSAMRVYFKQGTSDYLQRQLAHLGVDISLARRLQAAVVRGHGQVPTQLEQVSPYKLKAIAEATHIPELRIIDKRTSPTDGFTKYVFHGEDDQAFEAVRIPLLHRPGKEKYIVCVSSQVGCAMGCVFCATGKMGFQRNLQVWEMVDQVMRIKADSSYPIGGVVFMGMGEPFLNYERVITAASVMCEPVGLSIAAKAITISTVGIVPMIRRYTQEKYPYRLIVSLTAANSTKRRQLFPVEKAFPLEELMQAVREYQASRGDRATLAWTMLRGINTTEQDARELAELVDGLPVRLDIIDVNDASGHFEPPTMTELKQFRDDLDKHLAQPVVRRYSGGADVHAACGMLAAITEKQA